MGTDVELPRRATGRTVSSPGDPRRRAIWLVVGCACLTALLRLPFVWTSVSMDEGGYAYVARQWARGATLYGSGAWLDRPQGLLLTYRFLLWCDADGRGIRVAAVVAGVAITVLVAVIGWLLAGRWAGVAAAAGYAVAGIAPHVEAFTLNGELLASLPATGAVAAAVWWWRYRSAPALVLAGLLAGVAVTMKQSGVDGLVVGLAVVFLADRRWPDRIRHAAVLVGALLVPIAACVAHGVSVGWSAYWTAIAGYQLNAQQGGGENLHSRWHDFTRTLGGPLADVGVLLVVALIGLVLRRQRAGVRPVLVVWLCSSAVGINLGGSYWAHYYIQALPPLALLAGLAVAALRDPRLRVLVVAAVSVPVLIWFAVLVPASHATRLRDIPYYAQSDRDLRVAAAVRRETLPSQEIYALNSEAGLYFFADRTSSYPYLWGKPIEKIPGALDLLRRYLSGPDRPVLVLVYSPADDVDPSGELARELAAGYRFERSVEGIPLLRSTAA